MEFFASDLDKELHRDKELIRQAIEIDELWKLHSQSVGMLNGGYGPGLEARIHYLTLQILFDLWLEHKANAR